MQSFAKKKKVQTACHNGAAGWKRDETWLGGIPGILPWLWPKICKVDYYST